VSFAVLVVQTSRLGDPVEPDPTACAGGRRPVDGGPCGCWRGQPELLGILALTWFFNFL